jgi:polynucleotide 5'-kinase involved in rRNA processing
MVVRSMVDQKNLMIFGDKNSGKSSYVTRFLINHFYQDKQDFMDHDVRKMMR